MTWTPVDFDPGVFPDDSPRTAAGFFVDSDKVRFVRRRAQTIGGWEKASLDSVNGICRGLFGWRGNDSLPQAAIGTDSHLQSYYDGDIYNITPVTAYSTPTFDVTTTNGSATVTISNWTHNLAVGQSFEIENASPATVGGVTIDGEFEVLSVGSSTAITFTADSAATSDAGPTSVTADVNVYLAPGLVDGTAGPGFGVGVYSSGDYGEGGDLTAFYPRTWSFDQWGQNLIANPRGGAIYEWAPNYTEPQLVTNGGFATDSDWTKGTGWSIGSGVATATAGTESMLEQSIELSSNAYFLLEFDYTRSAGTLQPRIGTTAIGSALSAATGRVREVFYTGSGTLNFNKDSSFAGTVDNVSVRQLLTARVLPNAPTQNSCICVTPELILLAGGTIDADTGEFNPMQIRSSDTGDGDLSANRTWTIDPANLSRRWTLSRGSRIVRILNGNREVLCWTDTALYAATFTTDVNVVYRWRLVAEGCGLYGPNAATVLAGVAYWVTPGGKFMAYAGDSVVEIESPMYREFFNNLAPSQQDKIYLFTNAQYAEVWMLYPDFRDGNECSRYQKFNTRDKVWDLGTFDRTAWMDTGAFSLQLATSSDGTLYWQEKGRTADSSPLSGFLKTGALNKRRTMVEIMGMVPDFEDLAGGLTITVSAAQVPNGTPIDFGPYNISSTTEQVDIRALGYSPTLTFTWNSSPAFMRMGVHQFDMRQTRANR